MNNTFGAAVAVAALTLFSGEAPSAVIVPNSTITISGVNLLSGNASVNTTIGATVSVGGLSFNTSIVHDGPNSDWLLIDAVTGQTLAANFNAAWSISVTGIDFTAPTVFDSVFLYWTDDGVPFNPIQTFGGIAYQGQNSPINPAIGPVFSNTGFSIPTNGDFNPIVSVFPYSFLNSGGVNPSTANDYHQGLHFTLAEVEPPPPNGIPEPSTLALVMGFLGSGFLFRRKAPV